MKRLIRLLLFSLFILLSCKSLVFKTSVQEPEQVPLLNVSFKDIPGTKDEIYSKCEAWLKSTLGTHPKCCLLLNDRLSGELSGKYLLYCNETAIGSEVYSDITIDIHENEAKIAFRLCDPIKCTGALRDGIYYSIEEALSDSHSLSYKLEAYLRGRTEKI